MRFPGLVGAWAACGPRTRVNWGGSPPILLSSMLGARAARELRRIYRRIAYWRTPQDQGRSIPPGAGVRGPIFGAWGAAPGMVGCWRTYVNANRPSGHAQLSVFVIFAENKGPRPKVREDPGSKYLANQKLLRSGNCILCVFGVCTCIRDILMSRMHRFFCFS